MIEIDQVDPEFSMDLLCAVIYRAHLDFRRDPEARAWLDDVARRYLAETGGSEISAADIAWAALAVMWDSREDGLEKTKR